MTETIRMISTDTVWQLARQWEGEAAMIESNAPEIETDAPQTVTERENAAGIATRLMCADQLKQLINLLGREV